MIKISLRIFTFLICILQLFAGCQRKNVEIDIVEKACEKLRINSPGYKWIKDPSCNAVSDSVIFKVSFKHPSQKDCIEKIFPVPVFYDTAQNVISNVSYDKVLVRNGEGVVVYDDSATYILKAKFANISDARRFNFVQLSMHTENKYGNKSRTAKLRINGKCFVAKPAATAVQKKDTIYVSSNILEIKLFDTMDEDGDIVSLRLNGVWVLENIELTNAGETFKLNILKGNNELLLYAVNEGSSGPNTCAITINGTKTIEYKQDLKSGSEINIKF